MFKNKRFITCGVNNEIPLILQLSMWSLIDELKIPKDYLQIFELNESEGHQKITHSQEQPTYKKEYLLKTDAPFIYAKIYVIDDGEHSTMLLSSEY